MGTWDWDPGTAMENDLGDDIVKRLFETAGEKDRGPKHRKGAGKSLFDTTNVDKQVGEWHNFTQFDDMRDLKAEAAGDINAGQTHRLNRIAQGYVLERRDSVVGFGPSGRIDRVSNQNFPPPRPASFHSPNNQGTLNDKQRLAIAKEMAASYKSSGGKHAEKKLAKDHYVELDYGPPVHCARSNRSPFATSNARQFPGQGAHYMSSGGRLPAKLPANLPARLPGPVIRQPPGVRKAQQQAQSHGASAERRAVVARQRPFRLSTPEEYLKSVEASAGLGKSKHAPAQVLVVPAPGSTPETNGDVAKRGPSTTSRPVDGESINKAEIPQAGAFEQNPKPTAGEDQSRSETVPALQTTTQVVKPAVARRLSTPSLVSEPGTDTPAIDVRAQEMTVDHDLSAALGLLKDSGDTTDDLEMSFMEVSEEWLAVPHDEEFGETSSRRYPREGILEDNTVLGGPYYMAAIIAHSPQIADSKLGF